MGGGGGGGDVSAECLAIGGVVLSPPPTHPLATPLEFRANALRREVSREISRESTNFPTKSLLSKRRSFACIFMYIFLAIRSYLDYRLCPGTGSDRLK
jgi:hypothetical protein